MVKTDISLEIFKKEVLPIKNKLFRFALGIVKNNGDAEDVVQEVFIKVWNGRAQWAQIKSLEAWCMKLTRNLAIDKTRSKHRKTTPIESQYDASSEQPTPYQQTAISDALSKVRKIMKGLPENQRLVMQLRDIEEQSYKEISQQLEMPLSQVKINLFRARQFVRAQLLKAESYGI